MKYKHIYYLNFCFLLLFACCDKEDPEPPEPPEEPMLTDATMEGRHTLSFLLDDEVWESDRGINDLSSSISINGKGFSISSRKTNDKREFLSFGTVLSNFLPNKYYLPGHKP